MGPITNPANNHKYYIVSGTSWANDEAQAVTLDGHLTTVNNAAENTWIVTNLFKDFTSTGGPNVTQISELYIGFYDPTGIAADDGAGGPGTAHANNFVWVSGEPITYTNWVPGEPNNYGISGLTNPFNGPEYYGVMYTPRLNGGTTLGQWNDVAEHYPVTYGIVEVPEPSMLMGFVPAAMALARRNRR